MLLDAGGQPRSIPRAMSPRMRPAVIHIPLFDEPSHRIHPRVWSSRTGWESAIVP